MNWIYFIGFFVRPIKKLSPRSKHTPPALSCRHHNETIQMCERICVGNKFFGLQYGVQVSVDTM